METIKKIVNENNKLYRMFLLFISLLISAIIYNMFLLPLNIVTGGTGGIAQITLFVFDIDPAFMVLVLSLLCATISVAFLDFDKTASTIVVAFLYPAMVKLTEPLVNYMTIDPNDIFIVVIITGVILGFANGLMYKSGYSNGGLTVITQTLYQYFHIPVGKSGLIINGIIILAGGYYFGITVTIYAIISLYIRSIITDKVILGVSNNKAFYIITTEEEQVESFLMKDLGHNVTIFDVKGAFLEKKQKVIFSVIPSREYYRVTEGIKQIDESAFFVVTDSYEVVGGK